MHKRSILILAILSLLLCSVCDSPAQYVNGEKVYIGAIKQQASNYMSAGLNCLTPIDAAKFLVRDTSEQGARVSVIYGKASKKAISASNIYKQSLSSVAIAGMCSMPNPSRGISVNPASAFAISEEGICVTNYHVLYAYAQSSNGKGVLLLRFGNGAIYPVTNVLGVSAVDDVVLLKIDTKGAKIPYLSLSDADANVGDPAYVLGNPLGVYYSMTDGMVTSAYNDMIGLPGGGGASRNLMSISADFAVGASGSPILNNKGQVIGVVSSTHIIDQKVQGNVMSQMVIKNTIPVSSLKKLIDYINR